MAQENQRFKFKVKFYGWKSDKSWMSERKCKCLSQKSPEIRPTTIRCRRWLGETKVNVQYLQRCYKLQHIKEQVCIFGVRFEIPMIGNSLTGMELWNLLFDDTNINNTGIVKCTKKRSPKIMYRSMYNVYIIIFNVWFKLFSIYIEKLKR